MEGHEGSAHALLPIGGEDDGGIAGRDETVYPG